MNIGPLELAIVLLVVLLIFGPKRLPSLGRSLGSGMREFKDSITGKGSGDEDDDDTDTETARPAALARGEHADPLSTTPDVSRPATGERDEPVTRRGA